MEKMSHELIQTIAKYDEMALVLAGWPIAFIWFLKFTVQQNAKREERLLQVNEKCQMTFERVSVSLDRLAEEIKQSRRGGIDG